MTGLGAVKPFDRSECGLALIARAKRGGTAAGLLTGEVLLAEPEFVGVGRVSKDGTGGKVDKCKR